MLLRTLADQTTYRRLAYLLLGMPLGIIWFTCLVTLWSLGFGFIVTPMVIPVAFALAYATRGFTAVETELARALLDVDARVPAISVAGPNWRARLRGLFGSGFWRAQGFLWTRWLLGFPAGVLMVALLGAALSMITGPLWIPFVHGGSDVVGWHVHTLPQALALVPAGLVLLPAAVALAHPLGGAFRPIAAGLLREGDTRAQLGVGMGGSARAGIAFAGPSRHGLVSQAVLEGSLLAVLIFIWAATGHGYFWPVWVMLPMAVALGIHSWMYELWQRPQLVRVFRGSRSLAATAGIGTILWLFTVAVWAVSGHGYFWPIWTLLAVGLVLGAHTAATLLSVPQQMAERIETLTSSRAGAVNVQESELRRIERDLHDGAQARLVALGMSLGMAEQKLADDPDRAGELLAEARAGAEEALRELRALARGIHPPVLTDRGLEAAVTALANSTPLHVALSVDVPQRPPSPVETAAYFVVAEALANAAKHSGS